jgi:hypothetical protein
VTDDDSNISRRNLLKTAGISAFGLAGCSGEETDSPVGIQNNTSDSPTPPDNSTSPSTDETQEDDEPEPGLVPVKPKFSDKDFTVADSESDEEEIVLSYAKNVRNHLGQFDQIVEQNDSWQTWLDSIPNDDSFQDLKGKSIGSFYPRNPKVPREDYERFLFDKFESAEPTLEALDWIHIYGLAWAVEKERGTEEGFRSPFKDLNLTLAPMLERSINMYTENECQTFALDIHDEGKGNYVANIGRDGDNLYKMMMGFDLETNELFLMESNWLNMEMNSVQEEFMNYRTDRPQYDDGTWAQEDYNSGRTIHNTVQNSVYLPEIGKEDFEENVEENFGDSFDLSSKPPASDYWHPLRFDGSEPDMDELDFRTASVLTTRMLRNIVTHPEIVNSEKRLGKNAGVAPTKEYRESIPDAMLEMSDLPTADVDGEIEYSDVFEQSSILEELAERDENYVVHGTMFEPRYGRVTDSQIIENVWNDRGGEYDQIKQVLN